jgi:hypothetical protein
MVWNVPRTFHMKILFCFVMIATARIASAQLVSVGALGGVPFLDATPGADESRRYIVGPSVEVRLPAGFAVELDALYRRLGDTSEFSGSYVIAPGPSTIPYVNFFINRQRGNSWEFPLLGKYYFRARTSSWQPFIGTGWDLRTIGVHQAFSQTVTDPATGAAHFSSFHDDFRSDLGVGAVAVLGLRYRLGRLALLPQIRYTRWGSSNDFSTRKNEVGFLLGITF